MGVYIKGMKMPKSCGRCWFNNSSLSCAITGSCIDRDDENRERLDDCPISALPDKHGRLVDADALKKMSYEVKDTIGYVQVVDVWDIDREPTIVEAEDSE